MRSCKWIIAAVVFLSLYAQGPAPRPQQIRATLKDLAVTSCRVRDTDFYDYRVSTTFAVKNLSDRPTLVANEIRVITSESIASSQQDATRGLFTTSIKEEYQSMEKSLKEPTLDDLTLIKAGETRVLKFTFVLFTSSSIPQRVGAQILPTGRNWVVLNFSLLPEYFTWDRPSINRFRQKWNEVGQLDDRNASSEPFAVDIQISPNSPRCESH